MTVQEPTQASQAGTTMGLPPSHQVYATVMARAIVTRPHPGGNISLCKTSDHPSHKLSKRRQRERFLHEIIRKHVEESPRHRHCAALAGCRYRGRLVDLHNICRIRGSMGRVGVCCIFASGAVRVIGSESHVALDLAFFKYKGKRRLIAVLSPQWVISRHKLDHPITSAFGGKADFLAHLSACPLIAISGHLEPLRRKRSRMAWPGKSSFQRRLPA